METQTTGLEFWALSAKAAIEPEFYNGVQAAAHFGISTMTWNRWRKGYKDSKGNFHPPLAGLPEPYNFGGNPVWKVSELRDFEASRKQAA